MYVIHICIYIQGQALPNSLCDLVKLISSKLPRIHCTISDNSVRSSLIGFVGVTTRSHELHSIGVPRA